MSRQDEIVAQTDAPTEWSRETLDVRDLPPPQPLRRTLEKLADLEDRTVLLQLNDRAPQHLYPRLEERGYTHETIEEPDVVRTVIWPA